MIDSLFEEGDGGGDGGWGMGMGVILFSECSHN